MKKSILALLILATGCVILFSNARPILVYLLSANLSKQLGPVKISIGRLALGPQRLSLSGVKIIQDKSLDIKIKNISLDYGFFKREITKISLNGSYVRLNISQKKIREIAEPWLKKQAKGFLKIKVVEITGLDLNLELDGLRLNAIVSASLDIEKGLPINYFLQIISLEKQNYYLKNAFFKMSDNKAEGSFYVKEMGLGRMKIKDIKGKSRFEDRREIYFEKIEAETLDGKMAGDIDFSVREKTYSFDLDLHNIALEALAQSFDFEKKLGISGELSGNIRISAKDEELLDIKGDLAVPLPGGDFIIKDQKFLKTIASNSNQSLQMVNESFKDYHYSEGVLELSLKEGNLVIKADLNGEKGRRDFLITYHAFNAGDLLGLFNLKKRLN
jgi:hypothetical protein